MIRVTEAHHLDAYTLLLRFNDGSEGQVDLTDELYGPMFEPLKDPTVFRQFQVHPELHTVTWPNGADFAPEFLYQRARVAA